MTGRESAVEGDGTNWTGGPGQRPLQPGEAQVWYAFRSDLRPHLEIFSGSLSASERLRAARFHREEDRLDFTLAHGFLRSVLGGQLGPAGRAASWSVDPLGKPRLVEAGPDGNALEFSLSRASGVAVCAVGRQTPVGVDVERLEPRTDLLALAASAFTPRERAAFAALPVNRRERAFHLSWVSKEAILKLEGVGLGAHPRTVEVGPACWEARAFSVFWGGRRLFLRTFEFADQYVAALALSSEPRAVQFLRFGDPLLSANSGEEYITGF